jgi:CheY-like chemotaxis protein
MMRILLVEDHPVVAKMEVQVLQELGHEVHWSNSGEAALEVVAGFDPHLMLIDLALGEGMTGYDVVRHVRQIPKFQATPLVALTARTIEDDAGRAAAAGFTDYFSKPFDIDVLERYLQRSSMAVPQSP